MANMINIYDLITLNDDRGINTLNNFKKYLINGFNSGYSLYTQPFVDTYSADVMSDKKYFNTILNQILARTTSNINFKDLSIPLATEIKDVKESTISKYFNKSNIKNVLNILNEADADEDISTEELIKNVFKDVNSVVLTPDVISEIQSLISLDGMTRVIRPSKEVDLNICKKIQQHFYNAVSRFPLDINTLKVDVQNLYNNATLDTTLLSNLSRNTYIDKLEMHSKAIKAKDEQQAFIESHLHFNNVKMFIISPINKQYSNTFNKLTGESLNNFTNLFLNIFENNKNKFPEAYNKLVDETYNCVLSIINVLENILTRFNEAYVNLHRIISQNISDNKYGVVGRSRPEHSTTINSRFGKNIDIGTDSIIATLAARFGNTYFADTVYYTVNKTVGSSTKINGISLHDHDRNSFEIFSKEFYENIIPDIVISRTDNKEINKSSGSSNTRTATIAANISKVVADNVRRMVLQCLQYATHTTKVPYNRIDAINTIKDSLIVGDATTEVANNINNEINNIKSLTTDADKTKATTKYINNAVSNIGNLQVLLVVISGILNNNVKTWINNAKLPTNLYDILSHGMNSDLAADITTDNKDHYLNKLAHSAANTIENFMKDLSQKLASVLKSNVFTNITSQLYNENILSEADLMNYFKSQTLQEINSIVSSTCKKVSENLSNNKVKAVFKTEDVASEINNRIHKLIEADYNIDIANSPDTILKRYIGSLHDLSSIDNSEFTYADLDEDIKKALKTVDANTRKMITDPVEGIQGLNKDARDAFAKEITAKNTSTETYITNKPIKGKLSNLGRSPYEQADKTAIFSAGITNEQMNTVRCAVLYLLFCDDTTRNYNMCNFAKFITFTGISSLNNTRDSNAIGSLTQQANALLRGDVENKQVTAALNKLKSIDELDTENTEDFNNLINLEATYKKNDNLLVEFLSKLVKINNILKG